MLRCGLLVVASFLFSGADWKNVEQTLGRAGTLQPGGVYKVGFPRTDLSVTLDGVAIRPSLALGSWVAFKDIGGGHAMAMGDLVLLDSEVNVVIDKLQQGDVSQSAVHNHLLGESPHVAYVHFAGHGDAAALAKTIHDALALTKTPLGQATPTFTLMDLPMSELNEIIGAKGNVAGGVYQFSVPRVEKITEGGVEIPPSMGVATALNFQPTGNGRAAITGDFVMIASEVNPVIRVLRSGGIAITALHSHMLDEQPRLFFMHFWANDDPLKLARTLRTALDRMKIKR